MPATEHCFLCGISLPAGKGRRYRSTQELQLFVRSSCQPTPMAFAYITERADFPRDSPVCIPCVNWRRRAATRKGKTLLQVDQLVGYLLQPGRMDEPDQRCLPRLIDALSDDTSPFAGAVPLPARAILAGLESREAASIARAWWEFNGRSQFFRHTQTARIIRTLLKEAACDAPPPEAACDAGPREAACDAGPREAACDAGPQETCP